MSITRLRVNKIIGQVREDGAVQIKVTLPMVACVELGKALATQYGVREALVVPDHLEQKRVIGEAAGALAGALIEGRDLGVGIATGRTLSFAVRGLQKRPVLTAGSWVSRAASHDHPAPTHMKLRPALRARWAWSAPI